jgi:hypothetical protein
MTLIHTTITILIVSLAVGSFFYMSGTPINAAESLVVLGICAIGVYGAQDVIRRILRR